MHPLVVVMVYGEKKHIAASDQRCLWLLCMVDKAPTLKGVEVNHLFFLLVPSPKPYLSFHSFTSVQAREWNNRRSSTMETLLPVIVGGIIGLLGGLVGPPLAYWLNEGAARKRRRAEKLEELIGAVYEYDDWLESLRGIRVFGHEGKESPSPLARRGRARPQ